LEQVLMNLAVNASDAMPNGGQMLIETAEKVVDEPTAKDNLDLKPGRYVCLSVSDTGTGIPPDVLPRIFDPFFTTKAVGKGTGLGLATVFGIIKQHHGSIAVSSRVGLGTRFQVLLPASATALVKRSVASSESKLPGGSECILVAEDEPVVRASLCRILSRYGYQVLEAENGVQACQLWKTHRHEVRLVLTDLIMPGGISGRQLAQRLRLDKPQLKIVFTSGYSAEIAGQEVNQLDGEEFIGKPFQTHQLLETIRRVLDR
jgi:two-component system cell cycle sensor histidine kinase/response regulator CckA